MLRLPGLKKFKKRFVKRPYEEIEPHEIFLDALARKKEESLISERKLEVPLSQKRINILFIVVLLAGFVLFFKTFYLQVINHKKYEALAENNRFIFHLIGAERGVIYDSKGKQLVYNKPCFNLIAEKNSLPKDPAEMKEILEKVSKILDMDISAIKEKLDDSTGNEVLIYKGLNDQQLILFQTRIDEFSGFKIEKSLTRFYKDGPLFSHIIGYTGKISKEELEKNRNIYTPSDYVGKDGLEKSYEKFLRKNPGKIAIERDARGNIISKKVLEMPMSGNSLVLWLDSDLQQEAEKILKERMQKEGIKKGAIVAMDPRNGAILALISIPEFDNNLFNEDSNKEELKKILNDTKNQPLLNRAISGLYSPGSTIKPLIASAALEEKIISPLKKIYCEGKIIIPNKYHPENPTIKYDWRKHGWTDIKKAIAESCDVFFYIIGGGYKDQIGLGPSRIKKYLEFFGWGKETGIDLPGEKKGLLPSPEWKKKTRGELWWDGDTYNLSIGQGDILVTPLQVTTALSAVANKGTLFQPHLVKEIIDSNKKVVKKFEPVVIKKDFIEKEYLEIVREGMRKAVTGENCPSATAVQLRSLPVSAGAKTGTVQTGREDFFHDWITVFAPYEEPEIVLTVFLENVRGFRSVAEPIAKDILNWYFTKTQDKTNEKEQ